MAKIKKVKFAKAGQVKIHKDLREVIGRGSAESRSSLCSVFSRSCGAASLVLSGAGAVEPYNPM